MYGVVTEISKTIVGGRQLPRFCYRVDQKTGAVAMNRISGVFVSIYSRLPAKPRHPIEIWHDTKSRADFANKVNIHAKQDT